jgi:hypothetical protein
LPDDPKLGAASSHVTGGVALPKGPKMEASTEVKPSPESKFQARYNNFHPYVPVIHCEHPERGKWGKAPRDYRGLRKTWIAEDLSRKNRKQIEPAKVVLTAIPDLGLAAAVVGGPDAGIDAGADAGTGVDAGGGKCGCRVPGAGASGAWALLAGALGLAGALARRRPHRRRARYSLSTDANGSSTPGSPRSRK